MARSGTPPRFEAMKRRIATTVALGCLGAASATAGAEAAARSPAEATALRPALERARHVASRLLESWDGDDVVLHSDLESKTGLNRWSQHWFVDLIVNTHSMLPPASASQASCAADC